ncbi:MAG: B12-binding domain-containing radical SAM protein, partial [Nannocystaceae bacterium]
PNLTALTGVAGVAVHGPSGPIKTAKGQRIEILDDLPRPAWDLIPVDAYLDRGHASGVHRGRSMPVLTSRGCPYRCTFCSSPQMWTTRYLRRSPEEVVDEIEALVARYQVTNIDLNDLTAMLTKDWILEFCHALTRRGLGISWQLPSGTRSEAVDFEAARALYEAGCRNFTYAPESGSKDTLRRIKKKVKLPALRASLRASIRAGLTTHCSIIIGFPHEHYSDLWQTYKLVLGLAVDGLHTVAVMVFAPYPGSEEFEGLLATGAIDFGEHYYYSSLMRASSGLRSFHPQVGPRGLFALQLFYLCSFFGVQYSLRPWRFAKSLVNAARGRHESVMDQFLATKVGALIHGLRARGAAIRGKLFRRREADRRSKVL